MNINNFWVDITDISAKKRSTECWAQYYELCRGARDDVVPWKTMAALLACGHWGGGRVTSCVCSVFLRGKSGGLKGIVLLVEEESGG